MNGNVSDESHWLPPWGCHSGTCEVYRKRKRPLGCSRIHLTKEDPQAFPFFFFSFFFGASVREPSGDRLVTQRPRVSTREYGGWNRTGERGRSGDMSEMVKQKQRDASSLTESQGTLIWEGFSKAVYSLKNRACSSFRG